MAHTDGAPTADIQAEAQTLLSIATLLTRLWLSSYALMAWMASASTACPAADIQAGVWGCLSCRVQSQAPVSEMGCCCLEYVVPLSHAGGACTTRGAWAAQNTVGQNLVYILCQFPTPSSAKLWIESLRNVYCRMRWTRLSL